jgi:hypothetical protein
MLQSLKNIPTSPGATRPFSLQRKPPDFSNRKHGPRFPAEGEIRNSRRSARRVQFAGFVVSEVWDIPRHVAMRRTIGNLA